MSIRVYSVLILTQGGVSSEKGAAPRGVLCGTADLVLQHGDYQLQLYLVTSTLIIHEGGTRPLCIY